MAADHSNRRSLNPETDTDATEPLTYMFAQNCNNVKHFTLMEYTFEKCITKYF